MRNQHEMVAPGGEDELKSHSGIDKFLRNVPEAFQDTIRTQLNRVSVDSVTSDMSGISTTSTRHAKWTSCLRMDILQFRIMSRMLETVRSWTEERLFQSAVSLFQADPDTQAMSAAELNAQLRKDVQVLWGGNGISQEKFLRRLYDAMVQPCTLGDWELGYKRLVDREDGLSSLVSMCGASGRVPPTLAWAALLCAVENADGSVNMANMAHVITRVALRCKSARAQERRSYDVVMWLLSDALATSRAAAHAAIPTKHKNHMLAAFCNLLAFSHTHLLSQLLLQLLVLSNCMPTREDLDQGSADARHFVSSIMHAAVSASNHSSGELIFAEVQLSFGILDAALDAGLLGLQQKVLNCTHARPLQLDMELLRVFRARELSTVVSKLLDAAQRELRSLLGAVKLVFVAVCCHEEPSDRKAALLQLSPAALCDVCLALHHFMCKPEKAASGGTQQAELDLVAKVAADVVPTSLESFMAVIAARCLHLVAQWKPHVSQLLELSRNPAMHKALRFGSSSLAQSANTYAIIFLAGALAEYRSLARDWGRIRRIVDDVCGEAAAVTKLLPVTAAPIKGRLFDILQLDVEMAQNLPFAAALQHLAQCITMPAWLSQDDRSSMLDAAPRETRASFHAAAMAIEGGRDEPDMRSGLLGKAMVNKQRMDTVAFSIGGALFHAVALSCEQNSPVMKVKLSKMSNIYKQVIPMRCVGNLDNTSMYEAFTLSCEFMYTAEIEALEDAEVAINVWMVASSLRIRGLPKYVYDRIMHILPSSHMHILPGIFRQAHAAWQLTLGSSNEYEEQGRGILQAVMEFILCKMQLLVKKKVVYSILNEHGDTFRECAVDAIGRMLDMQPEAPSGAASMLLFKVVDHPEDGSVDFWRKLAAGALIRRYAKAWLRKQRARKMLTNENGLLGPPTDDDSPPSGGPRANSLLVSLDTAAPHSNARRPHTPPSLKVGNAPRSVLSGVDPDEILIMEELRN